MEAVGSNKTVVVTGACSGIGQGIAVAFGLQGFSVVINFPSDNTEHLARETQNTIEECNGKAMIVKADVTVEAEVEAMVAEALGSYGQLDVLVNNAGIAKASLVEDTPLDQWQRIIDVHLKGTFLCTRAVLPHMYTRNEGRIINTASQLAYKGAAAFSHYAAAKGAIISFTRSLALEIGERRVRVNCVAPGATMTPMLDDVPIDVLEEIRSQIPTGKLATIDNIVGSYLFLASEEASHYQGQCLSPNGGDVFL